MMDTSKPELDRSPSSKSMLTQAVQKEIDALNEAAWVLRRENSKESMRIATQAYALSNDHQYLLGIAESTLTLSIGEGYCGRVDLCVELAEKAKLLFESLQHTPGLIRTYNTLGYIYIVKSELGSAFEYLLKGIHLSKSTHNDEMLLFFYYNIGEIYKNTLHLYNEALHYLKQAEPFILTESHPLSGSILASIAVCYQKVGQADLSLEYAQKALDYASRNSDQRTLSTCYHMLALTYRAFGEYDLSDEYITMELAIFDVVSDAYGLTNATLVRAENHFEKGRYQEVIDLSEKALETVHELHYEALAYPYYWILAGAYEHLGYFEKATTTYKAYSIAFEKTMTQEVENRISVLSTELRFAEQQKEMQLRQRNDKLVALADLVTGVAHEINTPLGTAITLCSFVKEETDNFIKQITPEANQNLSTIEHMTLMTDALNLLSSSLNRTSSIVESFKAVSTDHHNLELRTLFIKDIFDDLRQLVGPLIKETHISIEIQIESNLHFQSYERILHQVLFHLVDNAVKHGLAGESTGLIRLLCRSVGDQIVISVSDNGIGIPTENLNKIFNPFYTTKKANGGIGLGLNIVHNMITQLLGGHIEVHSQSTLGTTFDITLPKYPL